MSIRKHHESFHDVIMNADVGCASEAHLLMWPVGWQRGLVTHTLVTGLRALYDFMRNRQHEAACLDCRAIGDRRRLSYAR